MKSKEQKSILNEKANRIAYLVSLIRSGGIMSQRLSNMPSHYIMQMRSYYNRYELEYNRLCGSEKLNPTGKTIADIKHLALKSVINVILSEKTTPITLSQNLEK